MEGENISKILFKKSDERNRKKGKVQRQDKGKMKRGKMRTKEE